MSSKFLLSAAVASITAALLAMPAQAAPFGTTPATALTETTSLVTTVAGRRHHYHHRVVRHGHRSSHAVRHGHQRRHGH